ncbi:MAG TPA: SRPBCC family protein [Candidatus Acidoferrales bacterium]|nr:SRPBCC family protein [Candidatus Acidoferrales bacterium]
MAGACSRARRLAKLLAAAPLLAAALAAPVAAKPVELSQQALDAFERQVRLTEARVDQELGRGTGFLWMDTQSETKRRAAYAELRQGQVVIERLETLVDGESIKCPHGLIHHWVGVIFVPGATLEQTLRLVEDYDHHADYYKPDVTRSKILEHHGNDYKVYLRFYRRKILTVVLDTEHEVHYFPMDATHAYSRSYSTRVTEVENPGKPDESQKPVGKDGGFLWRINTYWRFLERDGGTYVQCESVSLTRDIPPGLGWLLNGLVSSIPRESLTQTLTATRNALARKSTAFAAR